MGRYLGLFLLLSVSNGTLLQPEVKARVQSFIEASMECHHIPGMTMSIVKDDEVWTTAFGKEDFDTGREVDSNSKFIIASVTKAFTGTLLQMLLSEKGLDTRAKVTAILGPDFQFVDPYRTKELTLRDLLSHRTGLASLDFGSLSGFPASMSTVDFCKNLKYLPEELPIRDGFIYNNYMYMMLGYVVEVLGNDTWANLIKARILEPLGMHSTTFLMKPADVMGPLVARPYIYKDGKFKNGTLEIYDMGPIGSAGGILSTSNDMAKWIKFNLRLGKTESGKQLVDRKLMEEMRQLTTPVDNPSDIRRPEFPADDITSGYGYGWFVSEYRGYRIVSHNGGLISYITLLWTIPDLNIGVYASVNGPGYGSNSGNHNIVSFYYIVDHLLGLEPWLNQTTACTFPKPWKMENDTEPSKHKKADRFRRFTGAIVAQDWLLTERKPDQLMEKDTEEIRPDQNIIDMVQDASEFDGSYNYPLFAEVNVYSNSSNLHLNSNHIHGLLHPTQDKDTFLFEVTYPWELAIYYNTTQMMNITFLRDEKTKTVNGLQFHLEVDISYTKQLVKTSVLFPDNADQPKKLKNEPMVFEPKALKHSKLQKLFFKKKCND